MEQSLSRRAWTLFEPVHAIIYFCPESGERYQAAGLKGGWMGYFASRSAPMGPVGANVVTAVFHNFQPAMVRRAIPDAWRYSTPERVLAARLDAVDAALRRLWGDKTDSALVAEAAELALDVASRLRGDGRPLYAAHAGLDVPAVAHLALWHACTLLREHRFDGHVAALTVHGIAGDEALVTAVAAGTGVDGATLRRFRGWTDEEWADAQHRLRERGLLDEQDSLTGEGRSVRSAVEEATDRLAEGPWVALPESRRERLLSLLRDLAVELEGPGGLPYPNPIGVGRPV
ncbi:MAG TPA: hypothetical protein VH661_08910 [Candidatus Dormibacteraeota bacterium]|jgi:hypothetical protein|nr:hypothetical protein [Candidatus Dormibacteraeota bacterium]